MQAKPELRAKLEEIRNKQKVKRPHTVAQVHLRRFTGSDGRLWVLDKPKLKIFPAGPEAVTVVKGFFDTEFEDQFEDSELPATGQLIEELFCEIEAEYAPICESIIQRVQNGNTAAFKKDELWSLAGYIATQYIRTKEFRDYMLETHTTMELKKIQLLHPEIDVTDVKLEISDPAAYHVKLIGEYGVIQMLHKVLIEKHSLCLHRTTERHPFWTSDQAAVASKGGFLRRGNFFAFPLSPELLVAFYQYGSHPPAGLKNGISTWCKPASVKFLNDLQVKRSHRQVYSNQNRFESAIDLCEKIPELRNPDRPRVKVSETYDRVGFHSIDY